MKRHRAPRARLLLLLLAAACLVPVHSALEAQVTPELLLAPWSDEPHWVESRNEFLFFDHGRVKKTGERVETFVWDSVGRVKFPRAESEPMFHFGYKVHVLDVDTDNDAVTGQLNDIALLPAFDSVEFLEDWRLSLAGGFGTANDGHWTDVDSAYGLAIVDFSRRLESGDELHLGLAHDGNRGMFPDVPLPFVAYQGTFGEDFEYTFGVPHAAAAYEAFEDFELSLRYDFPVDVSLVADYAIGKGFHVFASYARSLDGFVLDGRDHRRIFHEVDRVTAGLRWASHWFDASVGVGYALAQRFRTGFDMRSLETTADLSEEVFLAIMVQGRL